MIISVDAEKPSDKIQHHFLIKSLQKVAIEVTYINIIKAIYDKHTAKIILNGEKLKAFPLRLGTRQGCPLLALLSNIVLEGLTTPVNKRKRSKRDSNWKRRIITVSFADDMILYIENPKYAIIKLLELIINLVKLQDTNQNTYIFCIIIH